MYIREKEQVSVDSTDQMINCDWLVIVIGQSITRVADNQVNQSKLEVNTVKPSILSPSSSSEDDNGSQREEGSGGRAIEECVSRDLLLD